MTKPAILARLKGLLHRHRNEGQQFTEEDLHEIINSSGEAGLITGETHEMLSSIIELKDTLVHEIMVPRTDFTALRADTTLPAAIPTITSSGFSRYPVYEENLDNIVGILSAKEILAWLDKDFETITAAAIMHPVHFIPETKKVHDLLQEFRVKGIHIAIAVDEYGGTSGLVTLSDLVEEIIGEIYEEGPEHKEEDQNIVRLDNGSYLILAKTEIEEIEDLFNIEVDNRGKFESVGGLVIYLFGKIPLNGETTTYGTFTITIDEADERRVHRVRFIPTQPPLDASSSEAAAVGER
ncbi:MAG: HlyC/CorC family transporter [Deltaproteobacteria bacterium]|nr:HlyC/CorC family transporter [Candidatus Anaeroferrophillacea bacterium]